jgi:cell wall-associated NlpC family hydrolase
MNSPAHISFHSFERRRVRLDGVSQAYDARVKAIRPDLADIALADLYFAPHYAQPAPRRVRGLAAALRAAPDSTAPAITELLHGETFHMLDVRGDWAWGYCGHDHYVGYLPADMLADPEVPSHMTIASAPIFSAADIKSPLASVLPPHARIAGTMEGNFLRVAAGDFDGFVHSRHVRPLAETETDWVAVAERGLHAPYVWGGRGGRGYDCSGLIQTALAACGISAPRDTDQQAEAIGTLLDDHAELRRGDIVFFPGHVGLMTDGQRLLHANAHWMAVTIEPLADVIARLADKHERPVTARRRVSP